MSEEKKITVDSIIEFIKKISQELEEKDALSKEYLNHLVRLKAEFENYKKRAERERESYVKFANEQLIQELLPVLDSLKLALESFRFSNGVNDDKLISGMEMILKSLEEVLSKNGLKKIESKGKVFNPNLHEVVGFVESDEFPENTILEEVKEGYTLNGKVVYPSRVKISKKPNPLSNKDNLVA